MRRRYAVDRAVRQYDAADLANRLVAGELETRWTPALACRSEIGAKVTAHNEAVPADVADPASLAMLASDLKAVWAAPSTDARVKIRIVRTIRRSRAVRASIRDRDAGRGQISLDSKLSSSHIYVMMQTAIGKDDVFTELVLAVFRLNGRLVETGNRLVESVGLTTAWWQVLGALALSPTPLPVASIARNMGLSRQSVQRTADLLAERGLVRFETNPHHQRAKLVVLTPEGVAAAEAADDRQRPFGRDVMAAVGPGRLAVALDVLTQIDLHLARVAEAAGQDAETKDVA